MKVRISEFAESVSPYKAGEQPSSRVVKLNTNENPYPPAPECERALKNFDAEKLKKYPRIGADELRKEIAAAEGVKKENVFVGNGSDEVLSLAFRALFDPHGEPVTFPRVTYSFYPIFCSLYGIEYRQVENESDLSVNVETLGGGQGAVLANPNAPTSLSVPIGDIKKLAELYRGRPVVIDEAYIDFASKTQSAVGLLHEYENIVVVKTFSKSYSLAGMRCGYAIASKRIVGALERVRDCFNSYPVDSVCQAVCRAALRAREYHAETVRKVVATRERVKAELRRMGRTVFDSETNFLLVSGGKFEYLRLKDHGILVRWFDVDGIRDFTRVSIGSDEEMDKYLHALLMR